MIPISKESLSRALALAVSAILGLAPCSAFAAARPPVVALQSCPRPAEGSIIAEPPELRSHNGVLKAELTYSNFTAAAGREEYCYRDKNGNQAPTLRLQPGDLLLLRLKNNLTAASPAAGSSNAPSAAMPVADPCASAQMTSLSTNLHFHGITVPPACHEDDVLHTMIQPGDSPFEYRFRIPADESPGLYWYHPHVHGFTNPQVLGGASGALIVEGIERTNGELAGLPDRTFVIRDQELLHPEAEQAKSGAFRAPASSSGTPTGRGPLRNSYISS